MKRVFIGFGILMISVFALLMIGRLAGFWGAYNIPFPSNEPSLNTGDKILITSFKKAGSGSLVVYKSRSTDSLSMMPGSEEEIQAQNYVHRLCGMPGDVLEMKNGIVYVNGKNFDRDLDLKQGYLISKPDADKLDMNDFPHPDYEIQPLFDRSSSTYNADTLMIMLDKKLKQKYSLQFSVRPYYNPDTASIFGPFKRHNKNTPWTIDNFGPLKIPADSCFVMGDNRHNSLDSRYTGFVAMKDISGVVIYKY